MPELLAIRIMAEKDKRATLLLVEKSDSGYRRRVVKKASGEKIRDLVDGDTLRPSQ